MVNFLSPILVSQSVTLTGNGAQQQANPTQLLNPNSTAMLIDQFRFSVPSVAFASSPPFQQVYANIQVGALPLTNGMVPLVAICPNYDSAPNFPRTNPLVWHLPKPLYVPPNVVTQVSLWRYVNPNDTYGSATAIPVRVAIAGRSLPSNYEVPTEIYVPWATASVVDTNQTTTLAGRQIYVTPDNMLGNPHASDLMVTRFLGYRNSLNADPEGGGDVEGPDTTTVKMTISNGKLLVREPTPFYHLFPESRRYFDMRAVLRGSNNVKQGGEFVRAQVSFQQVNAQYDDMNLLMLGMVGYRIAQTPTGAVQGATGQRVPDHIEALRAASLKQV